MNEHIAELLLNFVEEVGPGLRGPEAKELFGQVEQRYDDLRAATQWFSDQGRIDDGFRLASALVPFWMATKRLEEGSVWLGRLLAMPGGEDARRARAMYDAGYLAFWAGDYDRSSFLQNQAVELSRTTNDATVTALALVGLARIALRTDVEAARRLCREALAVTEGTEDRVGRSSAMHVLGVAAQMAGDFMEAREMMSQRIAMAREQGNLAIISSEAGNLSMVERQLGNLDEAEALSREALQIAYQRGDELATGWMLNGLAAVVRDRGQGERAATLIGIADAAMEAAGGAWPPDELVHYEQTVATLTEAMGSVEFERVRAAGHSMTRPMAMDFALGDRPAE
jgi:non-specific serine/threonine protein kinase